MAVSDEVVIVKETDVVVEVVSNPVTINAVSNPTTRTLDVLKGEKGGTSVWYTGSAPTGGSDGDMYLVNSGGSTGDVYKKILGTWTYVTNIKGPSGDSGVTQSYVDGRISALVNSAPGLLDTLGEISTALGNDANFSTTITTALSNKVDLSSAQTITGVKTFNSGAIVNGPNSSPKGLIVRGEGYPRIHFNPDGTNFVGTDNIAGISWDNNYYFGIGANLSSASSAAILIQANGSVLIPNIQFGYIGPIGGAGAETFGRVEGNKMALTFGTGNGGQPGVLFFDQSNGVNHNYTATVQINSATAATPVLTLKSMVSQTGNLLELQDSNGGLLARISSAGSIYGVNVFDSGSRVYSVNNKVPLASGVTGVLPTANLGSGTANSTTYLRGDGTWATISAGSSSLATLTDVTLASLVNNQALIYNSSSSKWSNATVDKTFVGLGNVDNTSDATKNTAVATLTNKVINGVNNTITNVSLTTGVVGVLPLANIDSNVFSTSRYPSISEVTSLNSALNAKADNSTVVHLTGNETIAGTKTFTGTINSTGVYDNSNRVYSASNPPTVSSLSDSATLVKRNMEPKFTPFGNITSWDNFDRTNRNLNGDSLPSGQVYTISSTVGGDSDQPIVNGRYAPIVHTADACILYRRTDDVPQRISASWIFVPGTTKTHDAVIGTCAVSFAQGSVQLACTPTTWQIFIVTNPSVIPYPVIASGTFATPLVEDSQTVHMSALDKDPNSSSLFYTLPDGTTGTVTDARINTYWGNIIGTQCRRSTDATDGRVEFVSHVSHGLTKVSFPSQPLVGTSLRTDDGTTFASTPTTTMPNDVDIRFGGVSDNWTASVEQGLIAQYGVGQQSYALSITVTGTVRFRYSYDGVNNVSVTSTVSVPFVNGRFGAVKVERVASTGTVTIYTSLDGTAWTQLGATRPTTAGALWHSTLPIKVGVRGEADLPFVGAVSFAQFGALGGSVLADIDLRKKFTGTGTSGSKWTFQNPYWTTTEDTVSTLKARIAALETTVGSLGASSSPPLVARKTTDTSRISTNTPTDDPELTVNVAANSVYEVILYLKYDGDAAADMFLDWTVPTGSSIVNWTANGYSTAATAAGSGAMGMQNGVAGNRTLGTVGVGTLVGARPGGILVTGSTAGAFTFKWAQQTSTALNTTVRAESTLILKKIA